MSGLHLLRTLWEMGELVHSRSALGMLRRDDPYDETADRGSCKDYWPSDAGAIEQLDKFRMRFSESRP
jgi:hypothetical protein